MKATRNLDDLTRTTRRREFEDGLVDLLNAAVCLIVGLLTASVYSPTSIRWYLQMLATYPESTALSLLSLVPLLAIFLILARRAINRIRRTNLWAASGYIEPLQNVDWRTSVPALLIMMIWVSIGFWGTQQGWLAPDSDLRFLISGIGIAAGVVYLVKGLNFHFSRYIVVGSIGGVLSGILMFVPFSFAASWAFLGILWSTILLLSGLVGLRKMLQMKGGLKNG
jgi:hypothetical protein